MKRAEGFTIVAILAGTIVLWTMTLMYVRVVTLGSEYRAVPACEEDQVLIGYGQFNGDRWSQYVCGPAVDDMKETK